MDYNGGAGVQHIALKTHDIISAVRTPSSLHPSVGPVSILGPLLWVCDWRAHPRAHEEFRTLGALGAAGARVSGSLDSSPGSAGALLCASGGFNHPLWASVATS